MEQAILQVNKKTKPSCESSSQVLSLTHISALPTLTSNGHMQPMATFGRVQGILKRPKQQQFWQEHTQHTWQVKGDKSKYHNPKPKSVSPLALNKEGRGRSCSGSPLGSSGVACMRPGYNQHWIPSRLFGFCTLAGISWLRADQGVHTNLWSRRVSLGVPGWQNCEPSVTWCP